MGNRRKWLARSAAAPAAVVAMVVATTAPAAAYPLGEDIEATVVGGHITVGTQTFELGEDTGPTSCNPSGDPSVIGASVDANGTIDNFSFGFAPSEQETSFGTACITLTVVNEGDLVGDLGTDGTIVITDPDAVIDAEIDHPLLSSGCGIRNVDVGPLSGEIDDGPPPVDAVLGTGTFNVPAASGCGLLGNGFVNGWLNLPSTGEALFELSVDW